MGNRLSAAGAKLGLWKRDVRDATQKESVSRNEKSYNVARVRSQIEVEMCFGESRNPEGGGTYNMQCQMKADIKTVLLTCWYKAAFVDKMFSSDLRLWENLNCRASLTVLL